jgi:hypothetical protein
MMACAHWLRRLVTAILLAVVGPGTQHDDAQFNDSDVIRRTPPSACRASRG